MRINVGVVGCGVGSTHIDAFKSTGALFNVGALCDVDLERAQRLAAEKQIPFVTSDFPALCERKDIDVIDICTPSYLHAPQVLLALASGKHTICEKPVAGSLSDIDRLLEAEAQSGLSVMPIFQNRFGAGVQKLMHLVAHGVAGKAYMATSETAWRRKGDYYTIPWRGKWETELGGPLVTLGIHAVDLIHMVLGPASSAHAFAATRVNSIETEDCTAASLRMKDGSLCSLSVTTGSADQVSRLRFCFEAFSAESNPGPYSYASEPWKITGDTSESTRRIEEALRDFKPLPEGYSGQFLTYHESVENGTRPPVTLWDARVSLETITAIYRSIHIGQAVDLPIDCSIPEYSSWRPESDCGRGQ